MSSQAESCNHIDLIWLDIYYSQIKKAYSTKVWQCDGTLETENQNMPIIFLRKKKAPKIPMSKDITYEADPLVDSQYIVVDPNLISHTVQ